MKKFRNIVLLLLFAFGVVGLMPVMAQGDVTVQKDVSSAKSAKNPVDVKGIIFGHIGDSYEWHITKIGNTTLSIPLPIIVYSSTTGWHSFLSSRLKENGGIYEGFSLAPAGSKYEDKLVEHNASGQEVRPFDISITKITL
ncbi:MAG: F0F1 ATP synthase subunit A, partial [Bacteroidaceae bacterium]